jgi:hypothetical protein
MNEDMKAAWLEISQMLGETTKEELDVFLRTWQRAIQAERNSWPAEMEAMERQVNILTDALAAEREACAKVCDGWDFLPGGHEFTPQQLAKNLTETIAAHIRKRGST